MAVCKRCGAVYDYNKREGVCPKCCFYNRPATSWQEDDSWEKNYNFEDNSYDVHTHDAELSDEDAHDSLKDALRKAGRSKKNTKKNPAAWGGILGHGSDKEVDGSHTHTSDGRVIRSGDSSANHKKMQKKTGGPGCFTICIIVFWIFLILSFLQMI